MASAALEPSILGLQATRSATVLPPFGLKSEKKSLNLKKNLLFLWRRNQKFSLIKLAPLANSLKPNRAVSLLSFTAYSLQDSFTPPPRTPQKNTVGILRVKSETMEQNALKM